jgi:two-component system, OmpR family, sensor histidine kinase KdpD
VLSPETAEDAPGQQRRWRRIAAPHPPGRALPATRLLRVPIRSADGPPSGDMHIVMEPGTTPVPARTTRILATVANQLGSAAEQEALRQANTDAELLRRADDLRRHLLDAVSHDLRTPLASIIAASGSLRQTDVAWTEEDVRDFAAAIEQEALRLNRIVGNLLDLGRIQDGSLVPSRDWHDPSVVLQDTVDRLRASLPGREITLDLPPDMPAILLDAVEIDQVVTNLVENAAHASVPTEPIRISAAIVEGELRVSVEDGGPGLPAGPSSRLFEPFVRGDEGPTAVGSGLGLAIARGLVAAHGGRIWAENRPRGGARFEFALPAGPAPDVEAG